MLATNKLPVAHTNNFTIVRFVAAICVIISHSYDVTGFAAFEPLKRITKEYLVFSDVGLIAFFTISGYLVSKSLQNSNSLSSFFAKRLLRIYPALIAAIALTVFVIGPIFSQKNIQEYFSDSKTWFYLTTIGAFRIQYFLPGLFNSDSFFIKSVNASLWSISLELKLYIGLSLLFFFKKNILFAKRILLIVAISLLVFIVLNEEVLNQVFNYKIITLIFAFVIGSNCFYQSFKPSYLLIASLILFTIGIAQIFLNVFFDNGLTIRIGIACFTMWCCLQKRLVFALTNDISYGVYIYAFVVQQMLFQLFNYQMSPEINILLTLLITVPIALISWKFIEEPALQLKQRFTKSSAPS
jgi:peptidoglycan/LPS O-acetylase OafA/YrhL